MSSQECANNCREPIPNHYYELGCNPIYNISSCCPLR